MALNHLPDGSGSNNEWPESFKTHEGPPIVVQFKN